MGKLNHIKIRSAVHLILLLFLFSPIVAVATFDPTLGGNTKLPNTSITEIGLNVASWVLVITGAVVAGFVIKRRF